MKCEWVSLLRMSWSKTGQMLLLSTWSEVGFAFLSVVLRVRSDACGGVGGGVRSENGDNASAVVSLRRGTIFISWFRDGSADADGVICY
jgi:hypothetical protein